jgi:hypothetical protein
MRTGRTLGAFALGLVAVFGVALAVGHGVGPLGHGGGAHSSHAGGSSSPGAAGLAVSQDGYSIELAANRLTAGVRDELAFTITGPDGKPLRSYAPTHDKDLHLVVVRRDLTGFQHIHPTRDAEGGWSVPLTLAEPGAYKVFADFAPRGRTMALVLGTELTVAGSYQPKPLPQVARTATVDGYTVSLAGDLRAGTASALELAVSKDGRPVLLQPYLAAFGHLVALRSGDLAYLHVHPEEGTALRFAVDVPTAGDYRLFLDFRHGDVVRTAAFTATAR